MTDETGAFVLRSAPTGPRTLRLQAIGYQPLELRLVLAPGDTSLGEILLPTRLDLVRDSLGAAGRWPPTLDSAAYALMQRAETLRVFRLDADPVLDAEHDSSPRVGLFRIRAEGKRPSRRLIAGLADSLRLPSHYYAHLQGASKLCGGFRPAFDLRYLHSPDSVEVLVCYACSQFAVWFDGRPVSHGDFDGHEAAFMRLGKRLFPGDRELGALRPPKPNLPSKRRPERKPHALR